jgi:hypothetical protein
MEPIEATIDRVFPKTIDVTSHVTMDVLAKLKTEIKAALPPDSLVELTMLMNTIQLGVYVPGDKWHRRACSVNIT